MGTGAQARRWVVATEQSAAGAVAGRGEASYLIRSFSFREGNAANQLVIPLSCAPRHYEESPMQR